MLTTKTIDTNKTDLLESLSSGGFGSLITVFVFPINDHIVRNHGQPAQQQRRKHFFTSSSS